MSGTMKSGSQSNRRYQASPSFSKTSREWMLSSALYDGIEDEDIRQVKTLLAKGANPNALLPEYGISPFHLAVANESVPFAVQATDICLQHGADPNVRSEDGLTPVHLAAMWGCSEVLAVLLASGGDPWLVDCFDLNALDYARREKQLDCCALLTANSCQLNLKRVVLYKNDLEIVYETSPPSSRKCVSTQTSLLDQHKEETEGSFNFRNACTLKRRRNYKRERVCENSMAEPSTNTSYHRREQRRDCKQDNEDTFSHVPLNNSLKELIINHRKNSTVFEYSPPRQESFSSCVESWRDAESGSLQTTSMVTELVEKLEKANKLRQSLKQTELPSLHNVTRRKKPPELEPILNTESSYNSCQRDIGFVLDEAQAKPNPGINISEAAIAGSPPSIGFILDNLDELSKERGSSLFSDIDTDIEVTRNEHNSQILDKLITEDEQSSEDQRLNRCSSTDSIYPFVSCVENTKCEDSSENFESCVENVSNSVEESSTSKVTNGQSNFKFPSVHYVSSSVNSMIESIVDNVDKNKSTPVNNRLITSTPEKEVADSGCSTERRSRGWVEAVISSSSSEDEQFLSVAEEYEYTDMDEGIVLIEKLYLKNNASTNSNNKSVNKRGVSVMPSSSSELSEVSSLSGSDVAYDTDDLRRALQDYGFSPGPINGSTKRVYLRKLKRFRRKPRPPAPPPDLPAYSPELLRTLTAPCDHLLSEWAHLEDSMVASFACDRRPTPWRQGQAKTSFTYLLLDPRLAHDLPRSALPPHDLWPHFLRSVFYVGKGKRSRPYAHLYQAVALWPTGATSSSRKTQRILDIWRAGAGVICLHVFLNIMPVEAYTREAAMLSALTLARVTNEKAGEFYGSAACWSGRLRRRLGSVLLYRALRVFLAEGERQLRPADID